MTETKKRISLKCTHCGNKVPMEVYAEIDRSWDNSEEANPVGISARWFWKILVCPTCHEETITRHFFHSESEEYDYDEKGTLYAKPPPLEVLYPSAQKQFSHLPEIVAKSYEEAVVVFFVSPKAFAVMAGRTLECVCKDKNAQGKDLFDKLGDLAARNVLPSTLADMAHKIRVFRNASAHADDKLDVDAEDARAIRELCEAILEYVYEAPAMVASVQARIDALKK